MMGMDEMPMGFGMLLAMNERAMQGYSNLSETQKEDLKTRCRNVQSKEEMEKIVDSLVSDGNKNDLYR